jgi:hypothetical protein
MKEQQDTRRKEMKWKISKLASKRSARNSAQVAFAFDEMSYRVAVVAPTWANTTAPPRFGRSAVKVSP